jgi:hypothetical protein
LFCGLCVFMLYQSATYAAFRRPAEALVVAALLLLVVPAYALTRLGDWGRGGKDEQAANGEKG